MKKLFLILTIVLAGCSTPVPVTVKFPDTPKEMLIACPDLTTVDPSTTKLSDILETVTGNYQKYYDCKSQVDDWITWYNTQKSIFDKIK